MRILFTTFLVLVFSLKCISQEKIKEAQISFQKPNEKWELKGKQNENEFTIYFYKREPIADKDNRQIIPNISFVIENLPNDSIDVINFSLQKRINAPFEVKEAFIHDDGRIDFENAIAYKAIYKDKFGEHTVFVVHLLNNKKGVQVIMDVLTVIYPELEKEFIFALKSLKIDNN